MELHRGGPVVVLRLLMFCLASTLVKENIATDGSKQGVWHGMDSIFMTPTPREA